MPSGDIRVEASAGQLSGSLRMASVKFVFVLPRNGLLPNINSYLTLETTMVGQRLEQFDAFEPRHTRKHRETTSRQEPNILSSLEPRALEKKSTRPSGKRTGAYSPRFICTYPCRPGCLPPQ
jgi:hypothetical protein